MPAHSAAPRVSVQCVFFNAERFLREAIESVLAQDYTDYELLLVDDGSFDDSTRIAKSYSSRMPGRIRYLEHPGHANLGISASQNFALREGRGEYVAFCDSDDVWRAGKLSGQVAILDANPDCGMICGAVNYWRSWEGGEDQVIQSGNIVDGKLLPPQAMERLYPVGNAPSPGPSESMIRRSVIDEVGGFEEHFKVKFTDQGLFAKLYLVTPVYFADRVWTDYRIHDESCSARADAAKLYLHHRRRFFAWLNGYLSARRGVAGWALRATVLFELGLLRFPLLWKVKHRLESIFSIKPAGAVEAG